MKNPRVSVSLNKGDAEMMHFLSEKKGMSMSALAKSMIERCLSDYEDEILIKRVESIEADWQSRGKPTISHEELWKRLDIE